MDKKTLIDRKYQNAQIIALLYSILFVGIIFYGYNNLLGSLGVFLCTVLSLILAVFAWAIARFIGYDGKGIRGNLPAFGLLLIISAVGIFNSLMLNLEGKRIFAQRVEFAQQRFNELELAARQEQKAQGIEKKIKEVDRIKAALISEIQSPSNCGNGPEARQLIMDLKSILVRLDIPSGKVDCKNPASIRAYVDAYTQMIDVTLDNADWNNPALTEAINIADASRVKLACISNGCASTNANYDAMLQGVNIKGNSSIPDLMRVITPKLEELEGEYVRSVENVRKNATEAPTLKASLELEELRSIGQASQILNLIIARAGKVTTWVYLLMAISFDALMVYFFANVLKHSVGRRQTKMASAAGW